MIVQTYKHSNVALRLCGGADVSLCLSYLHFDLSIHWEL